ncbi:MAG: serine protease, partial [Saprospiraceae bacterium]|nr:serine protease [Saprospiraceae bacterium]
MRNAQIVYLDTIEGLLEDGEIEKAIDALLALDKQAKAGLRNDIILQSGNFKEVQKDQQRGVISYDDYRRYSARAKYALLELMKELPQRLEDNAQIHALNTFQFEVPESENLEKIIGKQSNLLKINWLEKALQASKAVCRVVCANEDMGTGFLTKEGYIFTNQHVIPSADIAKTTQVEFNYELDTAGKVRARTIYQLDASDFTASPSDQLDFARVRVIDRPDAPLNQWGFVEFDPETILSVGDAVTIIQHPNGEDKQIALSANEVISIWDQYIFYTTDTDLGSSGSPVFNQDWRVVAIHHAGKTDGGGLKINARGDRRPANQGILFRNIFGSLGQPSRQQSPVPLEKKLAETTVPLTQPPLVPVVPPARPLSAVPKFVIVYDLAD